MTDAEAELIETQVSDHVVVLRLNRPERRNALATSLLAAIAEALTRLAADAQVRCVVITGSDTVFAAGADIDELAEKDIVGTLADRRTGLWAMIRGFPKPLVAAVEGWCLGAGNEVLMCCDIAVAGSGARFGQPETNLGIVPGAGGTATLPRLVGRALAMRMVLLGEPISASQALAAGLISEVVDDRSALDVALALAEKIAGRAPVAMRQAKALVSAALDMPHASHLMLERQGFAALFGTADRAEGIASFGERRVPQWQGS